jgi:hypothetical protein
MWQEKSAMIYFIQEWESDLVTFLRKLLDRFWMSLRFWSRIEWDKNVLEDGRWLTFGWPFGDLDPISQLLI